MGTPKKTECADTQIDNMNKDDKDDKNAGTVAMNDLCKRTEKELDEKGNDEKEMVHDSECVNGSESMEDSSSNDTVLACESQGEGNEEIHKIESSADISKDEFDSLSDLVIDENAENEEEEEKKMKSVCFNLKCADGLKNNCADVDISEETCGTDFIKASEETEETVTLMECTTESNDDIWMMMMMREGGGGGMTGRSGGGGGVGRG